MGSKHQEAPQWSWRARYRDAAGKEHARHFTRRVDELVFTAPDGGVLLLRHFRRRVFDRACVAAGLDGLTPHELRHTAASLAVSAGATVKAVQRMLGHASAAMTLDVYSGLFDNDLDAVADRLDGILAEPVRTPGSLARLPQRLAAP